jgi:UDP-glucose 4-epimerase
LPCVSLRLANVTGPRLTIGPIPTFYTRLKVGNGCFCSRTVRDFIDMDDFFSLMDAVLQPGAPIGVFNVSTGTGHTIKEIFNIVIDHLKIELKDPGTGNGSWTGRCSGRGAGPSKTIETFGWHPRYSFEQTIRRMLAWYDVHGVTAIYSHLKAPPSSAA